VHVAAAGAEAPVDEVVGELDTGVLADEAAQLVAVGDRVRLDLGPQQLLDQVECRHLLCNGHIGDTALQRHNRPRPLVQRADSQSTEPHLPQPDVHRFEANDLAGIRLADEHVGAAPLDASVRPHAARLDAALVLVFRQSLGQLPRRQVVELGRHSRA
jgi:hypothetical protein